MLGFGVPSAVLLRSYTAGPDVFTPHTNAQQRTISEPNPKPKPTHQTQQDPPDGIITDPNFHNHVRHKNTKSQSNKNRPPSGAWHRVLPFCTSREMAAVLCSSRMFVIYAKWFVAWGGDVASLYMQFQSEACVN